MPSKKYIVTLSEEEQIELKTLVSKGKGAAYRIKHAHILLNADENGASRRDEDIACLLSCHFNTVANVRRRFVEQGLDAALERKKRPAPPVASKLDGRGEARLIALACSTPPAGRAKWTLRLLADELVGLGVVESICGETVRQTLKKTNLSRTCVNVG
jgi:hypothetical protein